MNNNIFVTKSSMPPIEEYIDEIKELWDTHWLTNMGCKHKQLQNLLAEYLKVQNVELLTNGHMALELSLQALKLRKGTEVITTPFTFASTTHAIVRNGLKPVFCDIDPDSFNMDMSKIEDLISDNTSALLPVHVYGNICDLETIEALSEKYDLHVIYDAAHAFGVEYKGAGIGTFGDVSCFSFHATKVFNSIEGGAVCYKDDYHDFGRELYRLKNFGIKNEDIVDGVGANAKMNEFCAAMGLCNLRHIDDDIAARKQRAERYREHFAHIEGIQLSPIQVDVKPNYAYFPVIFHEKIFGSTRNEVYKRLMKEGIYTRKYFHPLTNTFDSYHGIFNVEDTPVALHISRRVLTLPLYADLNLDDVDRICEIIISCKK